VLCDFCGRALLYEGEDFMPTLALRPVLSEADHHSACLRMFRHPLVPGDLSRRATLLRKRRTYLPFYLLTGKRGGVLAIGKERIVARFPGTEIAMGYSEDAGFARRLERQRKPEVVVEEDSRVVIGDFRYLYAAAAMENWDFGDTALKEVVTAHLGEAGPVTVNELATDADVVDPDLPLERIVDRGVSAGLQTKGELKVLEMEASVVYVPVLTLSFRYGRQTFSLTLDEVEGTWLAGQLPFRKDWAYLLAVPIVAGLGLVVGNLLGFAARMRLDQLAASAGFFNVATVVGLILAAGLAIGLQAAWLLLRTPLVVRVQASGPRVERAGDPPKNPFAPANALLRMALENALKSGRRSRWDT
jgi:hypothetical protein